MAPMAATNRRDPLADTSILHAYAREIDEVMLKYPADGYRTSKDFAWRFTRRFQEHVWGPAGPPAPVAVGSEKTEARRHRPRARSASRRRIDTLP
jgi:hypothetical protein